MIKHLLGRRLSAAKLNMGSNFLNFFTLAALNLVLTPYLLAGLGAGGFGVWKACLRFLDLTSFADGRGAQALKWMSAFHIAKGDHDALRRLNAAAIIVWMMWLPLLLTVLAGVVYAIPSLIAGLDPHQAAIARMVATILAMNVVLTGLIGIPDAVLIGANQGYRSMNLNSVFLVVANVGFVVAALHGYGLVTLALISLGSSIANGACTWLVARVRVPWWGFRKPERADVGKLGRFSGWTLMWSLTQALLLSSELILFSWLIGAEAVASYAVTAYAIQSALSIGMFITSAKVPGIAQAVGAERWEEARRGIRQCREYVTAFATVAGVATILLNHSFVALWTGGQRYLGDTINALMVFCFFQLALIRCDAQLLDATLNIRARGIYGVVAAIAGLAGAWAAYRVTGQIVASYAVLMVIRCIPLLAFPRFIEQSIPLAPRPYKVVVVGGILLIAASMLGRDLRIAGWLELIVAGAVIVPIVAMAIVAMMSAESRRTIYVTIGLPQRLSAKL